MPAQMAAVAGRFDLIIDTVPYAHDLNPYVPTLATDGTIVTGRLPRAAGAAVQFGPLVLSRQGAGRFADRRHRGDAGDAGLLRASTASLDIELTHIQDIDVAYERMLESDVKYRFVIDMASLKDEVAA